jgi:hypothetical protein
MEEEKIMAENAKGSEPEKQSSPRKRRSEEG